MIWLNKLKHWHVFVILLIVPVAVSIVDEPGETNLKRVTNLFAAALYFGWVSSIAAMVIDRRLWLFIICILATFLVVVVASLLPLDTLLKYEYLQMPFIISSMVLTLTSAFVTGKFLSQASWGMRGHQNSIASGLLIFFYPIGIWILQPIINTIAKSKASSHSR